MNTAAFQLAQPRTTSMLVTSDSSPMLHCACTRAFQSGKLEDASYAARFAEKLAFTGSAKLQLRFQTSIWFNEHR